MSRTSRSSTGASDGATSWAIRPPHELVPVPDLDESSGAAPAAVTATGNEVA